MSSQGPIGAEVDIAIETWRMLTREELAAAYEENLSMTTTSNIGVQSTTGPRPPGFSGPIQTNGTF